MYIIKRNSDTDYPRVCLCEECGSKMIYNEDELKHGAFGVGCILCPICGSETETNYPDEQIELNIRNISYPNHFYFEEGGNQNSLEITSAIKKLVADLHKTSTKCGKINIGDTIIFANKETNDSGYFVYVSASYFAGYINT